MSVESELPPHSGWRKLTKGIKAKQTLVTVHLCSFMYLRGPTSAEFTQIQAAGRERVVLTLVLLQLDAVSITWCLNTVILLPLTDAQFSKALKNQHVDFFLWSYFPKNNNSCYRVLYYYHAPLHALPHWWRCTSYTKRSEVSHLSCLYSESLTSSLSSVS